MNEEPLEIPEKFNFPFTPYSIQLEFMKNLYHVIENRKLGIFESPTGTGKSLSIICGAIRWLKDHNEHQKEVLENKIVKLQNDKEAIAASSNDWLSTQSKEIEITYEINKLKLEQNKINEYDEKIEKIKNTTVVNKSKKWNKIDDKIEMTSDVLKDDIVEDNDLVLEEQIEEKKEDSDDEAENEYKTTKIYICSRTHSQLSQFIGEIMKSPFAKEIRVVTLASRQNYCINPHVKSLKSMSLINEKCLDMQKNLKSQSQADSCGKIVKKRKMGECKCPFYKQQPIENLRNYILTEIDDMEDLIKNSKELKACPYYASRLAAKDAEIILVPYNTILHKATREANGIDLKNNVLIIDEAHNLLEAMAQMYSAELSLKQIQESLKQVKFYKQRFHTKFSAFNLLHINQLIFVLTKLGMFFEKKTITDNVFRIENFVLSAEIDNYNMFKLTKFCKDSRLAQKIRSYSIKYPPELEIQKTSTKGIKEFLKSIENKTEKVIPEESPKIQEPAKIGTPLLAVIAFLESLTYSYNDGRIFIHRSPNEQKFQFLLLNPSQNFTTIIEEARSVIVAGGTMKPSNEFRDRLFLNSGADPLRIVEFSCDHIIPPENILPIIVTKGPKNEKLLFNYENRMLMGESIKSIIETSCNVVKGGIVVFFPSYKYESWIWDQIKNLSIKRPIFREPKDSNSVEVVLKKYSEAIQRSNTGGALLLSVVGGKLSEGLNFSDDLGRCIIVVGLPYANITAPDLKEKMVYLDGVQGSGSGRKFYQNLCMKAVNQSIGRAVRHRQDYATILLLDERYNNPATKDALPGWIKRSLKVCDFQNTFQNIQEERSDKNGVILYEEGPFNYLFDKF